VPETTSAERSCPDALGLPGAGRDDIPVMHESHYVLRAKSGAWSTHPDAHAPEYRLLQFDMTVERDGKRLGGHNVQVVVGAPDQERRGLDTQVALWLNSGWWVSLRNQFADAPNVADAILASVAGRLSAFTAQAREARGKDAEDITRRLFSTPFQATGPDYW
jgi:hypothetical protein